MASMPCVIRAMPVVFISRTGSNVILSLTCVSPNEKSQMMRPFDKAPWDKVFLGLVAPWMRRPLDKVPHGRDVPVDPSLMGEGGGGRAWERGLKCLQ